MSKKVYRKKIKSAEEAGDYTYIGVIKSLKKYVHGENEEEGVGRKIEELLLICTAQTDIDFMNEVRNYFKQNIGDNEENPPIDLSTSLNKSEIEGVRSKVLSVFEKD